MSTQSVTRSRKNARKRKDVVGKATEAALRQLAETDPVASYLKNSRGKLGVGHSLDY